MMGLFSSKNNQLVAAQHLKILKESTNIINQTKNPDTFFQRYSLAEEQADKLCKLTGVRYTGQHPQQIKQHLSEKKQAAIHDMIDRYFEDTAQKASKLKTASGKLKKFSSFITVLEDYYYLMNVDNIQYTNTLFNNSVADLKL